MGLVFYAARHTDFFTRCAIYIRRSKLLSPVLKDLRDEGHKAGRCFGWQGTQQSLGQKIKIKNRMKESVSENSECMY
jgi:hypothetical protein